MDQSAGTQPVGQSPRGTRGQSLISAVIGGVIVAIVFAVLLVTGVIGGETQTLVQQGVGTTNTADGQLRSVNSIYKESSPGVVSIKTPVRTSGGDNPFGLSQGGMASGSGAVVDKRGFIVTNAHVVDGNTAAPTVQFKTVDEREGKSVKAKIVGRDPSNDIAVLKVDPKGLDLQPIELGDSSKVQVGDPVVAIGSPFGLDQTVTTGIVSARQREIQAPNGFSINNVIQTDAAINPGNSGGPLLDAHGKLIGINSQIATSGGTAGNVGIGFAVPSNKVKEILPQLEKDGKVSYAYLGVSTTSLSPEIAGKLNFGDYKNGAIVACVVNGGPADKGGLIAGTDTALINGQELKVGGDLIVKIDGNDVKSNEDVADLVLKKKAGDTVAITVVREGKQKELKVKLGSRPADTKNNCTDLAPRP